MKVSTHLLGSALLLGGFAAMAACSSDPKPSSPPLSGAETVSTTGSQGTTGTGIGGATAATTTSTGSISSGAGGTAMLPTCAAGQLACGGLCVAAGTDNANCGTCGNACSVGSSCVAGACQCQGGLSLCPSGCVDLQTDNVDCGSCNAACAAGQQCQAGSCTCASGLIDCSGSCVDIASNPAHCGGCGMQCPAGEVCSDGACQSGCADGETECSGSCVNLDSHQLNCGSCGNQCSAGQQCAGGSCDCGAGQIACDDQCVDPNTDSSHCGECGTACGVGQSCQSGACACNGGQELCAGQCTDISQDPANCGACNNACDSTESCNDGSCGCADGMTLCSDVCVDTDTDASNCGSCNNTCQSGACSGGSCTDIQTGVIGWASVSGDGVDTTTGGEGGTTVSVSSASELQSQVSGASARIVQVSGTISVNELDVGSNKTIIGVGGDATINGGINISDESNVILQNLNINGRNSTADGDGIHVQRSHHIWIDHVNIWDASDGNLDINDYSNWITVSWSIFSYSSNPPDVNHRYSNLIGSGDGVTTDRGRLKVTWHHNWWSDRVHERMPRVRFGQVHVFNNYYTSSGNNYCIRAGVEANILVENNYFENVDTPHEIDASGAIITANGNTYSGTTGATDESGSAFDPPYPYTLESPEAARTAIQANAGPH